MKTFEDFTVGETLVSPGRTIEAADINLFAGLTGDFYPLHVDEVVAQGTRFGGRIAHGPLTFAIAVGLVPSGRYPDRSFMNAAITASHLALADAGITPKDVDTIVLIPCLHSYVDQADLIFSRVVEELGLAKRAKASFMVHSGGSTSD